MKKNAVDEISVNASCDKLSALAKVLDEYAAQMPLDMDREQAETLLTVFSILCDAVKAHTEQLATWLLMPRNKR